MEWIKCTDKLPKNNKTKEYLIFEEGNIFFAIYYKNKWLTQAEYSLEEDNPSHWMSLPEAPKD